MKKKFLALVLTLAMVLSLVPMTALATNGTSDTTTKDVVYGHYEGENGTIWTQGQPTRTDSLKNTVTIVNKTAEKVDGQNNQYEVTLTVQMKHKTEEVQPGAAATVLVIDTSGSMNDDNRLSAAKTAAINFLKSYSGFSASDFKKNGSLKNNVNVRDKKLKRYVSLVTFNGSASVEESWIDVSTRAGYNKLLNAIDDIEAGGGTNLDAALRLANTQMQSDSITQIDKSKRNVIALTDGVPTRYVKETWLGTNNVSQHGSYGCPDTNAATTRSADALKEKVNAVYTVCFGAANDRCWTKGSAHAWFGLIETEWHTIDGPRVGDFLKDNIATKEQYAYNADDANGLYGAFAAITQTITDGLNEGVVTDGLPAGVKDVEGSGFQTTWTLDSSSVTPTTSNGYNVYTYTKTYRVNVDPAAVSTVKVGEVNYAPLNTLTTLTVQHNGSPVVIHFPIPAGKVTENPPPPVPDSTDVYVYFQTQNTNGQKVNISGIGEINYNGHDWATLGKISTTQTLTSGTQYTGENDTLKAVGEEAKTKLTGNALCDKNASIAPTVLAHIQWTKLAQLDGADDYVDAGTTCWHLDGQITGYKVTYATGAGNENVIGMPTSNETYYLRGSEYTVSDATPQRTGYTFGGWMYQNSDNTTYQAKAKFNMPNENVTLTAQWTPNNGTKYKVEHYQQKLDGTYERTDTDTLSGETGASVTAQAKTYAGFTCDKTVTGTVESGMIAADGSLVLKLYYTRNSYNVTYQYEGTAPTGAPAVNTLSGTHKYGAEVIVDTTVSADAVAGYTFSGWRTDDVTVIDNTFTMPDKNVVFKGSWTPNTNTEYTVKYYQQNLEDDGYTLADEEKTTGTTGVTVTADVKNYPGFTYDADNTENVVSGEVTADGKLVLKLYYTRNSYKVSYELNGSSYSTDSTEKTYKYGATVTKEADPTIPEGNSFSGWTVETEGVNFDDAGQFTMPAKDVTVVGTYAANSHTYTIKGHLRDADGKDIENSEVKLDEGSQVYGLELSTLITDPMKGQRTEEGKNYVYVPSETMVTVNGGTSKLATNSKLTANDTVIDLYYYLDETGTPGKDSEGKDTDTPNGQPDAWEYKVTFIVKNGQWDTNPTGGSDTIVKYLPTKDIATGESIQATLSKVPTAGNTPNSHYKAGSWDWKPIEGDVITNDMTYTYTYSWRSSGGSGGSNRPKPPVVEIPDDVPTGLNGKDHYAYVVGYPDGMVYPQKNITRAEVATIFFRLLTDETREANMTKSNSYNDMKDGAWYTCAVSTLSKMGIIKGYEDGSFKPDASISRAEFAAIAARFDPDGDKTPATFSDVSSHWAKDEISIAANHGWIKGYEDGSFKPDQKITRAETMTLVNRVLKRLPETKDDLHKDMKTWPDNQNESAWFYLAVQEATNSHYQNLKKDGTHEKWESMRETRDWAALEK